MDLNPENDTMRINDGNVHREAIDDAPKNDGSALMSHLSKMAAVDIEFKDLMYSAPSFKKESNLILQGINGQFKSGEITAILGPSGAGKSTLLNILAGYKCTDVSGSISINGQPRDVREFRKMSCYIMQENLVQPKLTVLEALTFAADLKLGKRKSRFEKSAIIDEILNTLRLSSSRNTITDNLSGGERKRLIIALELVDNPPIIFLDEPTTGLDELSASQCIELLQNLAHIGRTVVCTVHSPSMKIFQKFDHVYVITTGQCIYRGSTSNLVPYMQSMGIECPKHYNPADFVIEISSGDYGSDLTERMIACVEIKAPILPIKRLEQEFDLERRNPRALWSDQFSILVKRMLVQLYRDRNFIYLKICFYIFLGLIIGGLFSGVGNDGSKGFTNFTFFFVTVLIFLLVPMMPILMRFSGEILLVKREHFNRWYDISAYYWALTIVEIPQRILLSAIYLSITYLITEQPLEWQRFIMFFGTCFLCSFIAESMAYGIASIFSHAVINMFIGSVITCFMVLFLIQSFGQPYPLPLYRTLLMYMTYIQYVQEAFLTAAYGNGRKRLHCPFEKIYCQYSSPKEILRLMGKQTTPNFSLDILVLVITLCTFQGILYYLLRQRVQPSKIFEKFRPVGKLFKKHFAR